jgi:hypothetical protein
MDGVAQDLSQQRGEVKDPRRGPGPILEPPRRLKRPERSPWGGTWELVGEKGLAARVVSGC